MQTKREKGLFDKGLRQGSLHFHTISFYSLSRQTQPTLWTTQTLITK